MKKLILIFTALLIFGSSANAQSLSDLYRQVQEAVANEGKINKKREAEFVASRNRQSQLLAQAKSELAATELRAEVLTAEYGANEKELAEMMETLTDRMGNLGELFGVVRQISGDVLSVVNDSMVSAQFPGRGEFLAELAQAKELPTTAELRKLWASMVHEISEAGKVAKFTAAVIDANGERHENTEVVRIGVFNAIADGSFLVWDTAVGGGTLVQLGRQPAGRYQSMAKDLENSSSGTTKMPVDFTRGAILTLVVKSKTPWERVKEDGGPVGWVIVAVGVFGLLLALWKFLSLAAISTKIRKQRKSDTANQGNPLGRVMAVYTDNPDAEIETLELKLDEAILRETAPVESTLSFIKVLYVVAPLLGLLGTVVGMIATFQMITLFGTGDPQMMAGGISTALVTTVLGLVVAIPLTLLHSYLHSRAKTIIQVLEEQAAGIIARLAEKRDAGTA
ncbi:MAG: MotA/TolQ/ExbB proton channel family protein [Xanthomonadales bacterium]|nr:MotA/TolQ/ExbB proton channel family protein [Xanthomonadales bacterium]